MFNEHTVLQLPDKLTELATLIDYVKPITKNTFLFTEGDRANELYIIKSGVVKVGKMLLDGSETSLRLCNSGEIIGIVSLYSKEMDHIYNAEVLKAGEVAVIKKEHLQEALVLNSNLATELMDIMVSYIQKDQMRIRDLISYGKKGALYSTLIRLSNSYGEKEDNGIFIDIALTNQDLANFCGASRESVNRLLNDLQQNNYISMEKGHLTIHNLKYLKNVINCENCPISLCTIH